MDIESKIELIKKSPTEEIITEEELREKLKTGEKLKHYIGFEISGLLHLGTLIICGDKINDLIKAGVNCTVYLADWHSYINKKLGENWDNIIKASKYYEEAFNFYCPGVNIVLGSQFYYNNNEYWKDLIRFATQVNLTRITRCLSIMGRSEKENLSFAQYIYPSMQAVDVKYLGQDIAHGGMDQRKVHVLCREVFPKLGWKKPILLHHHLIMGLGEPTKKEFKDKFEMVEAYKMSKSKPWTAIFIHDTEEEIEKKILRAWCPEKVVEMNPILEIVKYVIFNKRKSFEVERESKYGGKITYYSYYDLEKDYINGNLHPLDLKKNVARVLNEILEPIRKHFEYPSLKKLVEEIKSFEITR
jgi:tyrosyl-tRNA synthetase